MNGVLKEAIVFMYQLLIIASEWFHLTDHVGVSSPIVAVSDTYMDNISNGYSIPDEIPTTLAFSSVNWCKIDVFPSNIMVLHHKMSQTVKINVNRYTNIYLLMNLFKINQFIFIFSVFQLYFHSYNKFF